MSDYLKLEKSIESLRHEMHESFETLTTIMLDKFDQIDGRLESFEFGQKATDRRVDDVADQVRVRDDLEHRMTRMETKLGM